MLKRQRKGLEKLALIKLYFPWPQATQFKESVASSQVPSQANFRMHGLIHVYFVCPIRKKRKRGIRIEKVRR